MTGQLGSSPGALGPAASKGAASRGRAPHQAEIDLSEARKALFLMVGFIALIWIIQVVNWADHYQPDFSYGILPRSVSHLPDIFTAPFLHFTWDHIESNSGPLFVFGLLAAYRGVVRFLALTLLVAVTSGLAVWFFQGSGKVSVGASGIIFGYFGYVVVRGLIDRNLIDALIGLVMALSFAYLVTGAIPGAAGHVSWLGHMGGLVGGVLGGWLLRSRRAPSAGGVGGSLPRAKRERQAGKGSPGQAPAVTGGTGAFKPGTSNPRADLHKELDDLGL